MSDITPIDRDKLKKHFEANMLDGDAIQRGQMLASADVFEYLEDLIDNILQTFVSEVLERMPEQLSLQMGRDESYDQVVVEYRRGYNTSLDAATAAIRQVLKERTGKNEPTKRK